MRPFLIRVLILSMVGVLICERVEADPVVAFSNIPPPANYKVGGSTVTGGGLKALLFTTPTSSRAVITSVKVGLTYCNNFQCAGRSTIPVDVYPSQADFQVSIYSVRDQGGVLTPDAEIYSIPMQYGLTLTSRGTEFTFDIPNWQLAANTTYALVGRSTDSNPVKWGNIQLGAADYPPQPQNGFTFSSTQAFATSQAAPTIWIDVGAATNNAVEVKFLFVPSLSITNSPQTYSGSAIAAAVTCSSGGAISNVQYNGSTTVPTNAATYAVTANCAANGSYSALTGASAGSFVINAASQPTTLVIPPTVPTLVTTGGSVALSFTGGNGTGAVTYTAVALAQSPATANAVSPRSAGLQCTINGAVLTPTGGTGVCQVTATKAADANYQAQTSAPYNITVTAVPSPPPQPVPTLSEWAKISMMFLMILTVGWYGRRLKQR